MIQMNGLFALVFSLLLLGCWSCDKEEIIIETPAPQPFSQTFIPGAKIMPLGDSRVEGNRPDFESYRYELWQLLNQTDWEFDFIGSRQDEGEYPSAQFDTDHEGTGGATADYLLDILPAILANEQVPDIVCLGIGGNDVVGGQGQADIVEETVAEVNEIIDLLQSANPNVVVFLEQIAPGRSDFMNAQLAAHWQMAKELYGQIPAAQNDDYSRVILVDMTVGWGDQYMADEVHYNQAGAEVVAARYFAALEAYYE